MTLTPYLLIALLCLLSLSALATSTTKQESIRIDVSNLGFLSIS